MINERRNEQDVSERSDLFSRMLASNDEDGGLSYSDLTGADKPEAHHPRADE